MRGVGFGGIAGNDLDPFACAGAGVGGHDSDEGEISHVGGDAYIAVAEGLDVHALAVVTVGDLNEEWGPLIGVNFFGSHDGGSFPRVNLILGIGGRGNRAITWQKEKTIARCMQTQPRK
jgi:hypothetical protein